MCCLSFSTILRDFDLFHTVFFWSSSFPCALGSVPESWLQLYSSPLPDPCTSFLQDSLGKLERKMRDIKQHHYSLKWDSAGYLAPFHVALTSLKLDDEGLKLCFAFIISDPLPNFMPSVSWWVRIQKNRTGIGTEKNWLSIHLLA